MLASAVPLVIEYVGHEIVVENVGHRHCAVGPFDGFSILAADHQ